MTDLHEAAQQNLLAAIRAEAKIKRLTWALEGLCKVAERNGVDVTYWRELELNDESDQAE